MHLQDLLLSYIEANQGTSVANQFEDTWDNENFEDQNFQALLAIKRTLYKVSKANLLSDHSQQDLDEYLLGLAEYIAKNQ